MPKHQIQNLYSNIKANNNNTKKITDTGAKTKIPAPVKKQPAVPHNKPKPKDINAGITMLNIDELKNLLESYKVSFPDSHLVWLKGISSFLNSNINIETDPTFHGKSPNFPSNIVPVQLKTIIYETLTNAGIVNIQYFYDQTLTAMAVDLSKGQHVVGHKIILQLIGQKWPYVCSSSLAKNVILLHSYQNQSSIGLSLCWALGQGGYKDLSVGLRVWKDIMNRLVEMRAYSKFITDYIINILNKSDFDGSNHNFSHEDFFIILEEMMSSRYVQHNVKKTLNETAASLVVVSFEI